MPASCVAGRRGGAVSVLVIGVVCLLPACSLRLHGAAQPKGEPQAVGAAVTHLLHSAAAEDDHDAAVAALAAMGPAALPYLSKALTDPDEDVRVVAVETLGKMRGPDVVDALRVALGNSSSDVRLSAVQALGAVRDRRAVQPLLDQFAKDDNPQVRYECLTSLGLIGDPAAVGLLVKGTADEDPHVRLWAIDALCQMHDAHAGALAIALLRDPYGPVREQVIQVCGDSLNTAEGRRTLIDLALDANEFGMTVWARRHLTSYIEHGPDGAQLAEQVRGAALPALHGQRTVRAALLLGDLGDPVAVDPLIAAMRDPDFLVRHHAAVLLAKLRDRRAVPALIVALKDPVEIVAATAYSSLQWFADDGDTRAKEAVGNYKGKTFTERLPR